MLVCSPQLLVTDDAEEQLGARGSNRLNGLFQGEYCICQLETDLLFANVDLVGVFHQVLLDLAQAHHHADVLLLALSLPSPAHLQNRIELAASM